MSDIFDYLPPPRDGALPIISIELIHGDVYKDLGPREAAAFSRLMIYEKMPDSEMIQKLHDYLKKRHDYYSLLCAERLEILESGKSV